MELILDAEMYPKEALLKACYGRLNAFYFHLSQFEGQYHVEITPKDDTSEEDISRTFENELLSQTVRLLVANKTRNIRQLLMARAMASTIVDEENQFDPAGDSDKETDDDVRLEEILKDWFQHD